MAISTASSTPLATANDVVSGIPRAVAAIALISSFSYLIGWWLASRYFDALGAPWAVSMMTPILLLQLSVPICVAIGSSGYVAFYLLANGIATTLVLSSLSIVLAFIGNMLLLAGFQSVILLSSYQIYLISLVGGLCFAIAAGITIVELVGRISETGRKLNLYLVYWIVLYGLLSAPMRIGMARATYHTDPVSNPLPLVTMTDGLKWRLVYAVEGKALLMFPAKEKQDSVFRVVELKDLASIATVSQPSQK